MQGIVVYVIIINKEFEKAMKYPALASLLLNQNSETIADRL